MITIANVFKYLDQTADENSSEKQCEHCTTDLSSHRGREVRVHRVWDDGDECESDATLKSWTGNWVHPRHHEMRNAKHFTR